MNKSTPGVWPEDGEWVIVAVLDPSGAEVHKRARFDRTTETFTPEGERPISQFHYWHREIASVTYTLR